MINGKDTPKVRSNAAEWTLQQALDKTLSMPKPDGWRGCSYEKQATLNVQSAMDAMGKNRVLNTITLGDIDEWVESCEDKGNSDATVNRKLSALSKIMKVAHKYGGLAALPEFPSLSKER